MAKVINVKDLTNEQVAALEKSVGLFRRQASTGRRKLLAGFRQLRFPPFLKGGKGGFEGGAPSKNPPNPPLQRGTFKNAPTGRELPPGCTSSMSQK